MFFNKQTVFWSLVGTLFNGGQATPTLRRRAKKPKGGARMNADTKKLLFGRISKDDQILYYGLDEKALLTDDESKIRYMLRTTITGIENEVEFQDIRDKKWIPAPRSTSQHRLGHDILPYIRMIRAQALLIHHFWSMHFCANPLALLEKESVLNPEEVGRQHAFDFGTNDRNRIALANRIKLGDNPEAVGKANATVYSGDVKQIAECNYISFSGNPEKVGKANASSFEIPELIATANKFAFHKLGEPFDQAMYSSFETDPITLFNMFDFIYTKIDRNRESNIAGSIKKMYLENFDSFKITVLNVIKSNSYNRIRAEAVKDMGMILFWLVREDQELKDLLVRLFDSDEDLLNARMGAEIENLYDGM